MHRGLYSYIFRLPGPVHHRLVGYTTNADAKPTSKMAGDLKGMAQDASIEKIESRGQEVGCQAGHPSCWERGEEYDDVGYGDRDLEGKIRLQGWAESRNRRAGRKYGYTVLILLGG